MFNDMRSIIWKEGKSFMRAPGRRTQYIFMIMTPLLIAIVFPVQMGLDWLTSGITVVLAMVVPLLLVGVTIPDSFAGERERKTLTTLLASRMSDRSILFGKLVLPIALGWAATLVVLLISLIAVNAVAWDGTIHFYSTAVFLSTMAASLLMAVLVAAAGILFSLRAATVMQAQQALMASLLFPAMILQLGLFLIPVFLPGDGMQRMREIIGSVSLETAMLVVLTVMIALVGVLMWAALRRFQREKLVLR